jgi:hypothetical protein
MIIGRKPFVFKGKSFEVRAIAQENEIAVRVFDESDHGIGCTFRITWETASDYERVQGDEAVEALMRLAREDLEGERIPELKKGIAGIIEGEGRELAFKIVYKDVGNQEHEWPDRFGHPDEAVKKACELLNERKAKFVDIPDPKDRGGGGGLRHVQIVDRGKQLGYLK